MSVKPYKGFEPKWVKEPAPSDSYRSIFRWGDPNFVKYPKESLYKMMKDIFHLTDEDFKQYDKDIGFDKVELNIPSKMDKKQNTSKTTFSISFIPTAVFPDATTTASPPSTAP